MEFRLSRIPRIGAVFASSVALVVILATFSFFYVIQTKPEPWMKSSSFSVHEERVATIPKNFSVYWSFGHIDFLFPYQHAPIAFNSKYDDVRMYNENANGHLIIRDRNGVIYEKDIGEATARFIRFSPDLQKFAYVMGRWEEPGVSSKYTVVTKDWNSEEYESVSLPVFSSDMNHVSFAGRNTTGHSIIAGVPSTSSVDIILDGNKFASYDTGDDDPRDRLDWNTPTTTFHTFNNSIAFIVNDKGSPFGKFNGDSFVVYNGRQENSYSEIVDVPIFSKDGSSFAYMARKQPMNYVVDGPKNAATVVCNGTEGPVFEAVYSVQLSLDGENCYYIGENMKGEKEEKEYIVVNGKIRDAHPAIFDMELGSDGKTLAYQYSDTKDYHGKYIRVGKKDMGPFDLPQSGFIVFSPAASQVAFTEQVPSGKALDGVQGKTIEITTYKQRMVIGTERGILLDQVYEPVFHPALHVVAYMARDKDKMMVVVGNTIIGEYDDVWQPIVDDNAIVFGARNGDALLRIIVGEAQV